MSQVSQKEAVYSAVVSVLGSSFVPNVPLNLTKEQRSAIQNEVTKGITAGTVAFRDPSKIANTEYLKTYVIGLVSNWVRRDIRFKPVVAESKAMSAEAQAVAEIEASMQ